MVAQVFPSMKQLTNEHISDAILRDTSFMVIACNTDGTVIFFNAAAEKELGYSAEEIIDKQTPLLWHDAAEVRIRAEELSLELGKPVEPGYGVFVAKLKLGHGEETEWTFIRKDGTRFPVLLNIGGIRDQAGSSPGFLGIAKNISKRKQQERALLERDIFLDNVIRTVADALITTDGGGVVQSYNPACERLFGYRASEIIGKSISKLLGHGDPQTTLALYVENKEAEGRVITGHRKDGSSFPLELSVSRFKSNGNEIYSAIMRDVSLRDRVQAEREQLIERLTESNTEFERFAYIASHDMQEPLRAMSSFSAILMSDYAKVLDDDGKLYLKMIHDAAARMQSMVVDLLEYARVGSDAPDFVDFDAAHEYEQVLRNLLSSLAGSDAHIQADPLPRLKGLPLQFSALLQNLIGNSLKYRRPDLPADIRLGVEDKGDHWLVSVKDNGIGIEPEYTAKIFEPFKRLHNRQDYDGTGLGLSVCKKIVERHGGKIWCVSNPGEGSSFFFTWPK